LDKEPRERRLKERKQLIMPSVAVIMGSRSDATTVDECTGLLERLGVSYESLVASAHRTPDRVREFATSAPERGVEVIVAAAGGAAALPGVIKSYTHLPVIGIPLASSDLKGVDALYAIVQMPPGVPVATMAVGAWGARNAALLAVEILALKDEALRERYLAYRREQSEAVR
jgi:5-(carboxyamino)imidazole ribonucleotide mutase